MAGHGPGTSYAGFHPHPPSRFHVYLAKALGASMWFFVFYRARQDGPRVLGWRHPWEGHHADGHDEHGGGHH
ncbi:hypothetical protein CALVIDRAFT_568801 [Calocera viscosa TUFC12733]|uniref:NADH dehydrogenase [ubiquinone] 1 beta subcomplex subunit 2 n=1 Tax=Calocera viscosa (strain TUFC12733) TaxID=1330018 RepID=A0A167GNA3_CALVF|nr:hypothetical protein CALVIDRAFT_568801 [Calocera viscosa TUFC12733]